MASAGSRKRRAEKKKGGVRKALLIISGIAAALLLFYTFAMAGFKFPAESSINGIDVSGMTEDEAAKAIADEWNKKEIIIYNVSAPEGKIDYRDVKFDFKKTANECLYPGPVETVRRFFRKNRRIMRTQVRVAETTEEFDKRLSGFSFVISGGGTVRTQDAYVDLSTDDFNVVREIYGNNLDMDRLIDAILTRMGYGYEEYRYKPGSCYEKPKVTADSEEIEKKLEYCRKYLSQKIVLGGPVSEFHITPAELDRIKSVNKKGEVKIDENAGGELVTGRLAYTMNTCGIKRNLTSADGKKNYTVKNGNYGYAVDTEKEKKELYKNIKSGKDVARKPFYVQEGSESAGGNDIGRDYIEIDLSRQSLWLVTGGEIAVSSPIVSGNEETGDWTPQGVYKLRWKERDKTLKGTNRDDSTYESEVRYWMPFNGNIGMHDASWRRKFGGTIYKYNGSHGCINMPPAKAGKVYEGAFQGMPVIVHY